MAALLGVKKVCSCVLTRQCSKVFAINQFRFLSEKASEPTKTVKTTGGKVPESHGDPTKYHVPEYHGHNQDTYADIELELSNGGYRQSQPDPRVPYHHHYPWEKK